MVRADKSGVKDGDHVPHICRYGLCGIYSGRRNRGSESRILQPERGRSCDYVAIELKAEKRITITNTRQRMLGLIKPGRKYLPMEMPMRRAKAMQPLADYMGKQWKRLQNRF